MNKGSAMTEAPLSKNTVIADNCRSRRPQILSSSPHTSNKRRPPDDFDLGVDGLLNSRASNKSVINQ